MLCVQLWTEHWGMLPKSNLIQLFLRCFTKSASQTFLRSANIPKTLCPKPASILLVRMLPFFFLFCFQSLYHSLWLWKSQHWWVCVCACVCVCVHMCVCPSQAISRKLLKSSSSNFTWHGDCLRHENASHVNYVDLDLHSSFQVKELPIMKLINVWLF